MWSLRCWERRGYPHERARLAQRPPDVADAAASWREYERRKRIEIERNPDSQELAAFCWALAEELRI